MLSSKALWNTYPFTASSTLVPIDNLVVTSSAQLSPHLCVYKFQVTKGHAVQSLPSILAFINIFGANSQSRRPYSSPASIMVRLSSNHSPHASPFSAPSSKRPTSFRTASSTVSTSTLFSQFPESLPVIGAECEELSPLDGM